MTRRPPFARSALAAGVVAAMSLTLLPTGQVMGGCVDVTSNPNSVSCDAAQTTTNTTKDVTTDGNAVDQSDRHYEFTANGIVDVTIAGTGDITGFGLAVSTTEPGADIVVIHNGSITLGANPTAGGTAAFNLTTTTGNITYTGSGTIDGGEFGTAGLGLLTGGGNITVENSGSITGNTDGIHAESDGGEVTIDNDGTIIGNTGSGIHVEDAGEVSVDNEGLIQGELFGISIFDISGPVHVDNSGTVISGGAALHVSNAGAVSGSNTSMTSMISTGGSGQEFHGVASVTYDNSGLIAGLGDEGVDIDGVTGNVDYTNSGVIVGHWDGMDIKDVGGNVTITNHDGAESSGLILGANGDGIDLGGSFGDRIQGDVTIDNSSSLGRTVDISDLVTAADGANEHQDVLDALRNFFLDDPDRQELFEVLLSLESGNLETMIDDDEMLPAGIIGLDDGITMNFVGSVLIDNTDGFIVGVEGDGIHIENVMVGGNVDIVNEDGVIYGGTHGVHVDDVWDGNVNINNTGGTIIGASGDGIQLDEIDGNVTIDNHDGGMIIGGERGIAIINAENSVINNAGLIQGEGTSATPTIYYETIADSDNVINNLEGGLIQGENADPLDWIVRATGDGAITIDNEGEMIGRVFLTSGSVFDNFSDDGWTVSGNNNFGGGGSELNNSGTINIIDITEFDELDQFNNFASGNPDVVGTINMQYNSGINDRLIVGGNYDGGNGSILAIDAYLDVAANGGGADLLQITGDISGLTYLEVNDLNAGDAVHDPVGHLVVQVEGGADGAGNIILAGGPIDKGFFTYDLDFEQNGNNEWYLRSAPNQRAFEMPQLMTGAQQIWHQSARSWQDRSVDLRSAARGRGATGDSHRRGNTPGVWARGFGAWYDRDTNGNRPNYDQNISGFQLGGDMQLVGPSTGHNDMLFIGALGGYAWSDMKFKGSGSEAEFRGPHFGSYATYLNGGYYADMLVKADFMEFKYKTGMGSSDKPRLLSAGAVVDTGYRLDLNGGYFMEPMATLAYVHTDMDKMNVLNNTVSFDDGHSLRGRVGLRLGTEMMVGNQTKFSPYITGSYWNEFLGKNKASLSGAPGFSFEDKIDGTFSEVGIGVNIIDLGYNFSMFMEADYRFGNELEGASVWGGVRLGL